MEPVRPEEDSPNSTLARSSSCDEDESLDPGPGHGSGSSVNPWLQDAVHYYAVLIGEYDSDTLSHACLRLAEIINHGDSECLQYLFDKDVVGMVMKAMDSLPSHSTVQQAGCEALLRCSERVELRETVEDRGSHSSILAAMKKHNDNVYVVGKAVHALASFAATTVDDAGLKKSQAYIHVVEALKKHPSEAGIQSGGLLTLAHTLQTDLYAISNLLLRGDHNVILDALRAHPSNAIVVAHGCKALHTVSMSEEGCEVLRACGTLQLAVDVLDRFGEKALVVCAACGLIDGLTAESEGGGRGPPSFQFIEALNELQVASKVVLVIKRYAQVADIQLYGLSILANLCSMEGAQLDLSAMEAWLALINSAFTKHEREMRLDEVVCRCLARLLEINPNLHSHIGDPDNEMLHQVPLHTSVWLVLLAQVQGPDPSVFQSMALAIYFLVVDDERLQQLLLDKGAAEAVLESLREFLQEPTRNERCVEFGCRALLGLISQNCQMEKKNYLIHLDVLYELTKILNDFVHAPEVICEALGVIACLADLTSFQEVAFSSSLHCQVLTAVAEHHNHEILAESALEVLIIFSNSRLLLQLLNEADALDKAVSIMQSHQLSASIQEKGCWLIRLLGGGELVCSGPTCSSVAKVIVDAMQLYRTQPEVLMEALACAHQLCKASASMAEALLKEDIHVLLFNMICREEEAAGEETGFLSMVGTEILFNLSYVRDLKEEMLFSVVRQGVLEGVRVLVEILGADVDVGQEPDTPICLAVTAGNKEMVDLLVHLGATNVHHALSIAKETNQDDIIGLLLQKIAWEQHGDIVNLSSLELQTIKPRWILPSLGNRETWRAHRRSKSVPGPLRRLFLQRKSCSSVPDRTLEALRLVDHFDEPDSGLVQSTRLPISRSMDFSSRRSSHSSASASRKVSIDAGQKVPISRSMDFGSGQSSHSSASASRKVSFDAGRKAQSGRSSVTAATAPNLSPDQAMQGKSEPPDVAMAQPPAGVRPEELQHKLEAVATSTPDPALIVSTPRRKLGLALTSTPISHALPPIDGTPPSGVKQSLFSRVSDSGIKDQTTTDTQAPNCHSPPLSPRSRGGSESAASSVDEHSSMRTPRRRARERTSTVTGAKRLPYSSEEHYSQRRESDGGGESPVTALAGQPPPVQPMSPKLLQRRLTMLRNWKGSFSLLTSVETSRSVSPMPVFYDQTFERSHETTATPLSRALETDRITLSELTFSPEFTIAAHNDHERSRSNSFSSQSTPSMGSRRASIDAMFLSRAHAVIEEVDFEAIPEEKESHSIERKALVKVLDISSNQITSLDELANGERMVLHLLSGLHRLDLKQNNLSSLPPRLMESMKRLTILNLSRNKLSDFPVEAVSSPVLSDLDLSANMISSVPDLPPLQHLSKLDLSNNCLTEFPHAVHGVVLPQLRILNLRSNQISNIPQEDSKLRSLEQLILSKNHIREIPGQFLVGLVSLRELNASRNELVLLSGDAAADLVHLEILKVSYNQLGRQNEADFRNFITSAPVLQILDATENGITTIPPPYTWTSQGLREIRMGVNRISRLDLTEAGRYWPSIEGLYLSHNKLREVPKEIGEVKSLSCLDISHNPEIKHLPDDLGNLEHLFHLNLQGLKNLSLDPSILKGSTKDVISFLRSRHSKSVPYYHMKMMVVGGAGKGKTTLLHQLLQIRQPSHLGNNVATLGVNVKKWSYQQRPGVTYHLTCWDFAGQEEFYSTHQCFLSCRSLYVVVYDLSRGESELHTLLSWLLNIQARAPSSPVIVVGTHTDKIPPGEVEERRRQLRSRVLEMVRKPGFPNEVSFSEVSCFNERLINGLRRKIKELVDSAKLRGQKIMGGLVPSSYLELGDLIQKEAKKMVKEKSRFPVLHSSQLKELMKDTKLSRMTDPELKQAANFLHECGVLLHYDDLQSNLGHLYFLVPEWLCMLLAQVITLPEIHSFIGRNGLLAVRDVLHILREPKFPQEFFVEYIRLLETFEVALRQTPETLLIPSRLPRNKPGPINLPPCTPGSQLVRRYKVCYIPPGFWPRLLARLIAFPKRTLRSSQETKPSVMRVWLGGIYYFWSEQAFFLLELLSDRTDTFDITVPTTRIGTKLLCAVVDNVEALIDEWFPGLRDIDVLSGVNLVEPMSLCPLCPISSEPHCFMLSKLQRIAQTADDIHCPKHDGMVLLEQLAPDIVISDLDPKYKLSPDQFSLAESSSNFLGKGGFGEVYKAVCLGQTVAVKVYSQKTAEMNNTTPNQLIRQEVSILSQLHHPNIIPLVGVCLRPKPMLLLEYAELGSLSTLYPYINVSTPLKHRISLQVASALAYLHKNSIIYRDLKADNILLFSLSVLVDAVNAKLSDYGIACLATEYGLTQPTGTAGSKAPELIKSGSTYNDKVDIYSYGLLLFVLMTNGHKPFEELGTGFAMDKAVLAGRPIKDIEQYGCSPWPDMQDVMTHCLQRQPALRPSAQEVFDRLCSSEFICLRRAIAVERDHTVEAFTERSYTDKGRTKVEVWMATTIGKQSMLSTISLSEKNATLQGKMLTPGVLVYCMVAVGPSMVLLGTSTGEVLVYDGHERKLKHSLAPLKDTILCLVHVKSRSADVYYICAGLASGQLAVYDQRSLTTPQAQATAVLSLGSGPIRRARRLHGRLYVCCGNEIVVVRISDLTVEKRCKTSDDPRSYLTCVDVGHQMVWTAHKKSPKICLWDIVDGRPRGTIPCDDLMTSMGVEIDPYQTRVTALLLQPHPQSMLWVGLGSGHLLVFNAATHVPLVVTRRHTDTIRGIFSVKALVADKPVHLVLTGGFGFQQRPGYVPPERGAPESYGSILVWDSVMPRLKATYDDIKRQQEPYR